MKKDGKKKFKKRMKESIWYIEIFAIFLVTTIFTFLIFLGILSITPQTLYWLYSSFIQGFVTFLALFGTFFVFKISEIHQRQDSWFKDVLRITKNQRPVNKKVDLLTILKKMLEKKINPELKEFFEGYINLHFYLKNLEEGIKIKTQNLFILVVILVLLSIFGVILIENEFCNIAFVYGISINSLILVSSIALCSTILIQTINFFRKLFL